MDCQRIKRGLHKASNNYSMTVNIYSARIQLVFIECLSVCQVPERQKTVPERGHHSSSTQQVYALPPHLSLEFALLQNDMKWEQEQEAFSTRTANGKDSLNVRFCYYSCYWNEITQNAHLVDLQIKCFSKGQTKIWNLKSTNRIYSKILLKHLTYYKMQLDSLINKIVQITENKCFVI